jgi:hypothetical protein
VPAACAPHYFAFIGLELFYEILYMPDNHASGRRGNRICAEPVRAALNVATQGADSGNDRTRTFARASMPQESVPASAEQTRMDRTCPNLSTASIAAAP